GLNGSFDFSFLRNKDLNVKLKVIKVLEGNLGDIFLDKGRDKDFIIRILKVIVIKVKIDKWDLIKFKSFCIVKEIINRINR
ncbi:hypothetical protein, partial [Klebsiella pneumoniae]|uniref:hypothetical protein n=1 Tax=Klebsiella pneumoniae TaxID=573 RepID=UPI00272EFB7D